MTPTREESAFISLSRLLMIGGLVYHHLFEIPGSSHSPRLSMESATWFIPEFINSFFHMVFMTAVPLLSVISGYLFFRRPNINFKHLLGSRVFSVALPSWLWSFLWLAFAFLLFQIAGRDSSPQWADYGFTQANFMILINGVFGVTREPFAFQFWFVHDLLLTLLLSPVLYFFLLWLGWRFLLVMIVIWLAIPYPPIFFSGNVLMFFAVGAWLALPDSPALVSILQTMSKFRWSLLGFFVALLTLRLMSYKFVSFNDLLQGYVYLCVLRIAGVLTASALIYQLSLQSKGIKAFLLHYSPFSFVIFAVHFPLIEILQDVVLHIPGHDSAIGLFISWLLVPLLTIVIIVLMAIQCNRYFPPLFALLNGGRAVSRKS